MIIFNKRHNGVTLVEILVATGVFSLFMIGILTLFSQSRAGFDSGTWRLQRQKDAQRFLLRFKELLERSNHAYEVVAGGQTNRVRTQPIIINAEWYNQRAAVASHGIMYFSIISTAIAPEPSLGQAGRSGRWKGVGLDYNGDRLHLYLTGDWNKMPAHTPAAIGSPDLTKFHTGVDAEDFGTFLDEVEEIGIFFRQASETTDIGRPITIVTVELVLKRSRGRHESRISEHMTASLNDRLLEDEVTIAASGSFEF